MTKTTNQSGERQAVKNCHVCEGRRVYYLFSAFDHRMVQCDDCGLIFLNPQPSDDALDRIYGDGYFLSDDPDAGRVALEGVKQSTAKLYLSEIQRYDGVQRGRLLEIGCGEGDFLSLAESQGWEVTGVEYSNAASERTRQRLKNGIVHTGEISQAGLASDYYDLCVISDVLQHVRSPMEFLREIHRVLKPGGTLFVTTPSIDSLTSRFLRRNWMEFKLEHLTYFNRQTLQTALFKSGFREIILRPGWKILNFDYIKRHFERFPVPVFTRALKFAAHFIPKRIQLRQTRVVASGIMTLSRKAVVHGRPILSVIVAAYNEAQTLGALMDSLLRKDVPGLEMEIIVVESNSTDGTREIALQYQNHPRVKLVFEDQPRGKGHAVRTGLKAADGDYVLIQDADLEYDLEDYDALIEQLVAGRSAFVLGSRHGGRNIMKMRQFTGQLGLSMFLNVGHWFFATLINVLFLQWLRDPFTMFKVFRRDCLYGLEFGCNRFDFDFELLVKLIRKGYKPVEIPVNYRSRSFAEGKKVRLVRDPLNWLVTIFRLRFWKMDPLQVAAREKSIKKHSPRSLHGKAVESQNVLRSK